MKPVDYIIIAIIGIYFIYVFLNYRRFDSDCGHNCRKCNILHCKNQSTAVRLINDYRKKHKLNQ